MHALFNSGRNLTLLSSWSTPARLEKVSFIKLAMADAPKFEELPDAVLAAIINFLTKHAGGTPADVCRLLLVY